MSNVKDGEFNPETCRCSDCSGGEYPCPDCEASEAKMHDVKMIPVKSSNIKAVGYDDEGDLHVQFLNGGKWIYEGVSREEFEDFKDADSVGKFFHRFIRGEYEGHKAEDEEE